MKYKGKKQGRTKRHIHPNLVQMFGENEHADGRTRWAKKKKKRLYFYLSKNARTAA